MDLTTDQIIKILSPLLTLVVAAIIKQYTEKKSKLISYIGHISSFTLKDENKTPVYTHSIIVRNAGQKTAKNVKIGHYFLPNSINIHPPIKYTIESNPDNASEIVIESLVPKEQVTISYLYFPPVTWDKIHSYTKSDDGFAKIINVIPTPQLSKTLNIFILFLMFSGASLLVYLAIKLILKII